MKETVGIQRLDHVCWAVWKLSDALPLLTELLGLRVVGQWRNEEAGYSGVALEVPGGNGNIELLEPLGDDSFLLRFLKERGPGLHHVTFEVEDVEKAAAAMRAFGIEPFRGVRRSHGWAETYIHPRDSGGVLFQLYTDEDHQHDDEHEHTPPK
ncbi:MAG: VOC family protein [Chloroflexi bacterium]|nr:VOC family protein [Chloroflexota bacterium]